MDAPSVSSETASTALMSVDRAEPAQVFQPQKLTEIVEMIDLMGRISERMGEDKAGDLGGGGTQASGGQGAQTGGGSTRDDAITNLPTLPAMQKKIVQHIQSEIHSLDKEARKLSRTRTKGSAYLMTELYKKIRRLSSLMEEILEASIDMIKRFYIALFIDHQTLLGSGGLLAQSGQ